MKFLAFCISVLCLAACGNNPSTYIRAKDSPIVNIESTLVEQISVSAEDKSLVIENQGMAAVNLWYKLFWYDQRGVTQTNDEQPQHWQTLFLVPQQKQEIALQKPTAESQNYRVYVKATRPFHQ